MAPDVNWDLIGKIAKGTIQFDNDESTEKEIDILRNIDENEYKDDSEKLILLIQSLKKAFEVCWIKFIACFYSNLLNSLYLYIFVDVIV